MRMRVYLTICLRFANGRCEWNGQIVSVGRHAAKIVLIYITDYVIDGKWIADLGDYNITENRPIDYHLHLEPRYYESNIYVAAAPHGWFVYPFDYFDTTFYTPINANLYNRHNRGRSYTVSSPVCNTLRCNLILQRTQCFETLFVNAPPSFGSETGRYAHGRDGATGTQQNRQYFVNDGTFWDVSTTTTPNWNTVCSP